MPQWDPEMPELVDADSAPRGRRPGFIPPPPGAQMESGPYNPFPGAPPMSAGWPNADPWPAQRSPWPPLERSYPPPPATAPSRYGFHSPISPYESTPSSSWGGTPGSWGGPATPAGGFANFPPLRYPQQGPSLEPALGQPISQSPWFGGGVNLDAPEPGWPFGPEDDPGPERRPSMGAWPSPAHNEYPLERARSYGTSTPGFGGGPPIRRSLSSGGAGRRKSQNRKTTGNLQRFNLQYARQSEEYSPDNLARRPRDWRPDYDSRTLAPFIPRIQKPRTDIPEFADNMKRTIHDMLSYNPHNVNVSFDMRYHPHENLDFPGLERPFNHIDLTQLATNPPVHAMRLFHPLLPWYVDVVEGQPNGITVNDLIFQMHMQLDVPVTSRHFYNEDLHSTVRERIYKAFAVRVEGNPMERDKGVKRVDFLEGKVFFVGLVRAKNNFWEMKASATEPQ
ncbi:hypothetical protein DXG01_005791 [Tephrocybe rancida]|nr:hypothetical protein DXG01_005791 [Tephrocybe rancida]